MSHKGEPAILSFTRVYPHAGQPRLGLFVRERMARVAARLPVTVVVPQPWFPLQSLIRKWRPRFRPPAPKHERQGAVEVFCPMWPSVPGVAKGLDAFLLALGCLYRVWRLHRAGRADVIDAHWAYPDGAAAGLLGAWLGLPVTVTFRGNEIPMMETVTGRRRVAAAVRRATHVFAVSASLGRLAVEAGAPEEKVTVIPNGVDTDRFRPVDRVAARQRLGLEPDAPVLVTVGRINDHKGQRRVVDVLPSIVGRFPGLRYLLVGEFDSSPGWERDFRARIRRPDLADVVHPLGEVEPDDLRHVLGAASVFVLATRSEGWANVFLEAMACGLPVVTTDVGGNREVVPDESLGILVPPNDPAALQSAIATALDRDWDREHIRAYACANGWDRRIGELVDAFHAIGARQHIAAVTSGEQ